MERCKVFEKKWSGLSAAHDRPYSLRNLLYMDFSEFYDIVFNRPPAEAEQLIQRIYAGDAIILKNVLSVAEIDRLQALALTLGDNIPASSHEVLTGCPDWHGIADTAGDPRGGYTVLYHSYNFFRWNRTNTEIFSILAPCWTAGKFFNGHPPDAFENNVPDDGLVDRVMIINYPHGGGHISCHNDPDFCCRAIMGVKLSRSGTDYEEGGFYILNATGEVRLLETEIGPGDAVCWHPSLPHGVMPIDPDKPTDFSSHTGRWFVAVNTIEPHSLENRHRALPYSQ